MSDLLRIGAQGIAAYRGALTTVGENVVNARTPGYQRRDVTLRDTALVGGGIPGQVGLVGGVAIDGVTRASNAFLEADIRLAGAEVGNARTMLRFIDMVEGGLSGSGLNAALADVYATADALAGDPGSRMARQGFLHALDQAAAGFRSAAEALDRTRAAIAGEAGATLAAANADLAALADTNQALARATPGTNGHAALLDERDRRLNALSEKIGIDASFDAQGRVSVRLAGGGSAPPLVSGANRGLLGATTADDGRLQLTVVRDGERIPVAARGGALGGLVEAASSVADRRRALDAVAAEFAGQINAWSAAGTDAGGTGGVPLLTGTDAATLTAPVTDPDRVPAARGGVANGNLLALSAGREAGGIERRAQGIADDVAQQLATTRTREQALTARLEQAEIAHADATGIDIDREAGEVIRYQQAYDASSRVIQVARETLQSILALF